MIRRLEDIKKVNDTLKVVKTQVVRGEVGFSVHGILDVDVCVCVVYKKEDFCLLKPVSLNIVTNLFTRSTYQLTIDTDYVLIASITLSTLFRQTI